MSTTFTIKDVEKIARTLNVPAKNLGSYFRLVLENPEKKQSLALEIYPAILLGKEKGSLISIYTTNTHVQLQFCTGYIVSESLGEVTFYGESGGKISGLIVDRSASCSIYANVDRSILSGDLSKLAPEVMLSSIALSLTESELR